MKRRLEIIVILLLFLFFSGPALAGSIRGTVHVRGLRSPAGILVYLAKAPTVTPALSGVEAVMDQRDLTFIPHVLPILVGTTVHFPNNDKVSHNVFSLSRTKKFNLGSYKPGQSKAVRFDKPGIVELRCDVHAEMLAYILVMKNPYWTITDEKGRFKIPDPQYLKRAGINGVEDLPSGSYTIKTWHEKLKTMKKRVQVAPKGEATIEFTLTRGVPGVLYK